MPQYTPYPTSKVVPSRKQRKAGRRRIFTENKRKGSAYQKNKA